jgi:hypothetical protein
MIVLIVLCESIYNVSFRLLNIPIISLRSDSNNDIQSLPSYLITLPNYNVLLWRINLHIQRLIYDLAWITSITILIYYMKCITVEWIGGAALGTYDNDVSRSVDDHCSSAAFDFSRPRSLLVSDHLHFVERHM